MNMLHVKYAVEVCDAGSINKASEKLLVAQPALSRAIKELEADLNVTIFDRSAKGMQLTSEGAEFIRYAKEILSRMKEVEDIYKNGKTARTRFSVAVPRASYISDAFVNFSKKIDDSCAEVFYKETNAKGAIKNVLSDGYDMAIVRYAETYDKYFKENFEEKGLVSELVSEFKYVLIMNKENPLAKKKQIFFDDLAEYVEIAHADPFVPSLPISEVRKEELSEKIKQRIFLFERASQFDLLAEKKDAFMWVSPVPERTLSLYGLVQRKCMDNEKVYKDVLIHKKEQPLSELDKLFITEVCLSKRKNLDQTI